MFTSNAKDNFSALTASLQMTKSFEPAGSLIQAHLAGVANLLQKFIKSDPLVSEDLRAGLADLSERSIVRLVTSPYLCEMLMILEKKKADQPRELRQQVIQGLVAEVLLHQPGFKHPFSPKWTFDGDVVLDPEIAGQFPAQQTECGIRLNYQSYAHNTSKPGIGGYSFEVSQKHRERIETAKYIIHQVSAPAASLVDGFTTAIQFRVNKMRENVVNSSTHTSIGLIRCDNFHKIHDDMPEIVDMLVHESIHQYLHLFEEQISAFVNLEKVNEQTLNDKVFPSPWSGNLLDLRSYTHAILVWYGLWHFWSQMAAIDFSHPELTKKHITQKIEEAALGFNQFASVLSNLGAAVDTLNQDYVRNILRAQSMVRSA